MNQQNHFESTAAAAEFIYEAGRREKGCRGPRSLVLYRVEESGFVPSEIGRRARERKKPLELGDAINLFFHSLLIFLKSLGRAIGRLPRD
jgi:hypothetical protein